MNPEDSRLSHTQGIPNTRAGVMVWIDRHSEDQTGEDAFRLIVLKGDLEGCCILVISHEHSLLAFVNLQSE
jgi:hypothetical protein